MSVHRLAKQQSHIRASWAMRSAIAVASNVLHSQPDWLYQVELDRAQEWLESGIDPSIVALNPFSVRYKFPPLKSTGGQ